MYPSQNNNQPKTIPNESESWCTHKEEMKEVTRFRGTIMAYVQYQTGEREGGACHHSW